MITADAPKVWRELRAIAFKPAHPLHVRHAFRALCLMAAYIFPKPAAAAVEGDGRKPAISLYDLLCGRDEDSSGSRSDGNDENRSPSSVS